MTTRLEDTTTGEVVRTINEERHRVGATATGMVLTLVVVTDEENQSDATRAAAYAAEEHPCRIITVIPRPGRVDPQLDAYIDVADTMGPGETVRLRLRGELSFHAASVVLPLLLPDTPVVAWWPSYCPDAPAEDAIGRLAQRRITDLSTHPDPWHSLNVRRRGYHPGDTDLAWTRTTVWRSLLAAALDVPTEPVTGARMSAEASNPSAALLRAWLSTRLDVPVEMQPSEAQGISAVTIETRGGPITLTRSGERTGRITRPDATSYEVPLPRRPVRELMGEELRRLDPDDTFAAALAAVADQPRPDEDTTP